MAFGAEHLVGTGSRPATSRGESGARQRRSSEQPVHPAAKMPRKKAEIVRREELRRILRPRKTAELVIPAKKATVKKAAVKAKKQKVVKGKTSDLNQEPSSAPAQNGENKEA